MKFNLCKQVCVLVMALSPAAGFADANLQTLIKNASSIKISNAGGLRQFPGLGGKVFSLLLAEAMLTHTSPSGDPAYTKQQVLNTCEDVAAQPGVEKCELSFNTTQYYFDGKDEHRTDGGEASLIFRYRVRKIRNRVGALLRSIVDQTVEVIPVG